MAASRAENVFAADCKAVGPPVAAPFCSRVGGHAGGWTWPSEVDAFLGAAATTSEGAEDNASARDELLDLIVGMQSRRMDEQRTSLPQLPGLRRNNHNNSLHHHHRTSVGSVPEDDFFDMIVWCQGSRLEDQRSSMPTLQRAPSAPVVPSCDRPPRCPTRTSRSSCA
ncbi:uncharacterized protein LOC144115140 [Amblyomma americanum]